MAELLMNREETAYNIWREPVGVTNSKGPWHIVSPYAIARLR